MLSIELFWLLFCLFRFNRNTDSIFRYRSETTEINIMFRIVPKLCSFFLSSSFGCFKLQLVSKDTLVKT